MKLWLLLALVVASPLRAVTQSAPQPPLPEIEPTWVYSTPIRWRHAPTGIHESWAFATVVVLYPEGQFFELHSPLIRRDDDHAIFFSAGDGQLMRTGTWARTDDAVIRVHSREVQRYRPNRTARATAPGPWANDTCGLEGRSATHLARVIHCNRVIVSPNRVSIGLTELQRMAADAFHLAPLQ